MINQLKLIIKSLHLKIINYLHKSEVRSQVFIKKIISKITLLNCV